MGIAFQILHVLTAVFIVGPMAIVPMTALRAVRAGEAKSVKALSTSTLVFSLLSLLTVIFGFGLAGVWEISMSQTWVWLSVVLWALAFILSVFVVVPAMRKAAAALTETPGEGTRVGYGAIAAGSGISSILLLVVVILMVWQP